MELRKILQALSVIGPAILVSVELFDPASIVTATASGAAFGLDILWAAFYSGLLLIVIQEISARLGVVTGKTLAENIHEHYGRFYPLLLFLPSVFLDLCTLTAEIMGLSLALSFIFSIPYTIAVLASVGLTSVLVSIGSYDKIEKLIMLLVTTVYLSYMYFLFQLNIPPSDLVIKSIIPSLNSKSFYYAEAIIGAAIMPTYVILHSGLVYEKGWVHHHHRGIEDLAEDEKKSVRNERIDSVFSLLMGTILNIVIIACAAAFINVKALGSFTEIALPFNVRLGTLGLGLFAIAFGSAGISAVMTVGLASVYNTLGFLGIEERMRRQRFRLAFVIWVIIAGIASLLPNQLQIMIFTQYLNGALLPFVIIPLVLIAKDEKIMGENRIGNITSVLALTSVAITTLLFLASLVL